MELLLAFAVVLFVGVLLSGLAHRTLLSTAVLFLVAGFVLGEGVGGVLDLEPDDDIVVGLAELALFSVLYTDGMRVGLRDLRSAWRLPGRALVLGMPLTFGVTAVLAHYVAGLPWAESMLVGAVLAPTDPVFASAIVGREEVPGRLRSLLNVESGLNDGLALPVVLVLLSVLSRDEVAGVELVTELALGVVVGVVVPLVGVLLIRSRFTSATPLYASLGGLSIGLSAWASPASARQPLPRRVQRRHHHRDGRALRGGGVRRVRRAGHRAAQVGRDPRLRGADLAAVPRGDPPVRLRVRRAGAAARPADRDRRRTAAQQDAVPRAGGRRVVRAQGLRLSRLRPAHPRCRCAARGRDVRPRGARHRRVDPGPSSTDVPIAHAFARAQERRGEKEPDPEPEPA